MASNYDIHSPPVCDNRAWVNEYLIIDYYITFSMSSQDFQYQTECFILRFTMEQMMIPGMI